ncbi:AEC family transporter [Chloroflexota bacterium]
MKELLSIFANNLLPILLIAGAGYLLGKFLHVDPRPFGKIIFYVLIPVLVVDLLTRNQLSTDDILRTAGFTVLLLIITGAIAVFAGKLLKLKRPILLAVLLTTIFANVGNYGLPLISFAYGEDALSFASIYYITIAFLVNTVGVLIASMGKLSLKESLLGVLKVPSTYSIIAAIILIKTDWLIPAPMERTITLLSSAAIPSMLILLGLQLQHAEWTKNLKAISMAVVLRLIIGPIIGFLVSGVLGMKGPPRQAGIVDSALPTAVLTTILATEYDLEPKLVTSIVFITTILSPLTLTPILFFIGS